MLTFGNPGALWLGLAVLPVIALYLLRRRFRRRPSGSNFLWLRVASSAPGARRPELRSVLLLALQVAAVLCAALSAAAPSIVHRMLALPGLAILVDVSASMASADLADPAAGIATRVDAAAAAARASLAALPEGTPIAVFACGASLRPLGQVTADRRKAAAYTRLLAPTDEAFREEAVASALASWLGLREEAWNMVLYTDGGLDMGGSRLSAAGGRMRWVTIGRGGMGLGLASLRLEYGQKGGTASFRAWNGEARPVAVSARLEVDGDAVVETSLVIPNGWSSQSLPLAKGAGTGAWLLSIGKDGRTVAETRLAVYPQEARRILLVGRDDPYLRAALSYPGIVLASSASFPEGAELESWDLVVAEGLRAPAGFACPLLSVAAIPEGAPLSPGPLTGGGLSGMGSDHPLSRFVAWEGSRAAESLSVVPGRGVSALAGAGGLVVAAAWTEGVWPRAFIGFDPARSDFGLSPSWPLFLRGLLDWCAPRSDAQSAYTFVSGDIAQRAEPPSFRTGGTGSPGLRRAGKLVSIEPRAAGFYRWSRAGAEGFMAVNRPAEELDTVPRNLAPVGTASVPASSETMVQADLAGIPLFLLLACLVAEWILWRGPPLALVKRRRDARH